MTSVIPGRAFVGFQGMALSFGSLDRASSERFQLSFLRSQQAELDRQITAQNDLVNVELEGQRKLVELQQVAMEALGETIDLVAEAQALVAEETKERGDALNALVEGLGEQFRDFSESALAVHAQVIETLLAKARGATASAALYPDEGVGQTLQGWPNRVADIRRTCNVNVPPGWFLCNGTLRMRDEYPALAAAIGGRFGGSGAGGGAFFLPTKAELTSDTVMLADDTQQFYIRY